MIFKKDNFVFGFVIGMIAPILGFVIFKYTKLAVLNIKQAWQFMILQPGHNVLTVAISLSLLANAVLFTLYINTNKDYTAKGIFAATLIYGLTALALKTFG